MYYEYFNLKEHPFRLTCEPKYFYLGPEHAHANAMMEYALIQRQGMMLLTGEVGTGKTMLLQHFASKLEGNFRLINIIQTQLSELEFLQLLLFELNDQNPSSEHDKQTLYRMIVDAIEGLEAEGQHTVIFVDEAQNLLPEIIVRLYELSNVRKDNQRICTIYLVGQGSLREMMDEPVVQEFVPNVISRYHLGPLNLQEIRKYIYHRLAVAGGHKAIKFTKDVFPVIEAYTGGRPRLINVFVDHVLTYAFTEEQKGITVKVIDAAIADMQWLPFGVGQGNEKQSSTQTFLEERRRSYMLLFKTGNNVQGEFLLQKKRINIGRHRDNDLRIDDPLLSRHHAQVIRQGRTMYLRDLNSTNGTYVNSKRIDIMPLHEGTVIRVGNCELTFMRNTKHGAYKQHSDVGADFTGTIIKEGIS